MKNDEMAEAMQKWFATLSFKLRHSPSTTMGSGGYSTRAVRRQSEATHPVCGSDETRLRRCRQLLARSDSDPKNHLFFWEI